ncbi:MAG: 2-oxo acid dehydrogenase subunit E2 [Deltaproteobacteria bacterium]|nr:2-oxo acid dehydrogenase subunit E2 [Deltaproteobacteria bacterium]
MEFRLPELGEKIETADVVKVLVKPGDRVGRDQSVLELETDKAVIELPSPVDGVVGTVEVKVGDRIRVGQVVMEIEESGASAPSPQPSPTTPDRGHFVGGEGVQKKAPSPLRGEGQGEGAGSLALASPMVRRLARELGVDINLVSGTGFKGRVSFDDVKRFVFGARTQAQIELPDFSKWGPVEKKPMSQVRIKTAQNVSLAWTNIPHVTQFDDTDITKMEGLRKKASLLIAEKGGRLTVTALMVKIAADVLKEFPRFNASLDMANQQIVFKKYCHVGIAVDTDRGLIVPVIRNADTKSILELAVELPKLAEKARNKTLTLEEMQGGTFTITNLGGIGGTYFTPIIHTTQAAILGLGKAKKEALRLLLPLSLSYDHRLIDGADAARFLGKIAERVEQIKEI